jgi:small subunit ribosomal protein S19
MAKKEFTFRGKSIEELIAMDLQQFSNMVGRTRIKRTIKRWNDMKLLKKVEKAYNELKEGKQPKLIRTHRRDLPVLPKMVGLTIAVHNGKEFVKVQVIDKMLGHYFGELVLTRKRLSHGKAGIGATKSSTAITARG